VSARAWLESLPGIAVTVVGRLEALVLGRTDLIWIHGVRAEPEPGLVEWLQAGGRLLLSLDAVDLPARMGLETAAPDEWHEGRWHAATDTVPPPVTRAFPAFPHLRGLAAFGPHPLFRGLDWGVFTWAPTEGEPCRWLAYRHRRPTRGAVVAVERTAFQVNADRLVAWEYAVGDGGILCLGAFICLAARAGQQSHQLKALLSNAVAGEAVPHTSRRGPACHWPVGGTGGEQQDEPLATPIHLASLGNVWDEWTPSASPLLIESTARADHPFTLAGRRVLVVGGERAGPTEVWVHPFRAMRGARLLVNGSVPEVSSVRVAPDEIVRILRAGNTELTERLTTSLDHGLVFWSAVADGPVPISLEWITDLRRMWPHPPTREGAWLVEQSPSAIRIGLAGDPHAVEVHALTGTLGTPGATAAEMGDSVRVEARADRILRVVMAAGADEAELGRALDALRRRKLRGIRQERLLHARRLEERLTRLETPDAALNRGFGWAKVRVDSFLVDAPGVGRSLAAGYGPSASGPMDGRPGDAWCLGRDACWTAFASLAMGDREIAKEVLRFLARTQDASGKVAREYTTSGLASYDAADATPLFLLLAARYAAWSGDLDTLAGLWSQVMAAYRFCLGTDRDGDGLIENHGVGHGWIEHGPLSGLHVELYVEACWLAVLEGLAPVAHALGFEPLAEELVAGGVRARDSIRRRFHADADYAHGLDGEGRLRMQSTALLAVPLLLGAVDAREVPSWFESIVGEGFTAPWGVRLIAADDPLFDPVGIHCGTVWPFHTGCVSLAEWRAGRWEAALAHLKSNASLAADRAKGAFDERLHGLVRAGAGCPDLACSAAMVISPVIEGLWGVVPDALNHTVQVSPYLPNGWNEMALRRLRVGPTTLDLRLRRRPGRIRLRIERVHGPRIRFAATVRSQAPVDHMTLDDEPLGGSRAVFEASGEHELEFGLRA
jgi:glycogen debranching enzyme